MKFGRTYLLRIPTEFQLFAVDYEELKHLMKLSEKMTLDKLEEEIARVDSFILSQLHIYPFICDPVYQKNFKLFICLTRQAIAKILYKIDNDSTAKLRYFVESFIWFRSMEFNTNPTSLSEFFNRNEIDRLNRTRYHYNGLLSDQRLELGDGWNTKDRLGHFPIFYSVQQGNVDLFLKFLDAHFVIEEDSWEAIIKLGKSLILKSLISQPKFKPSMFPPSFLHSCCLYDKPEILNLALPYCNVNQIYKDYSPLMIAAKENSIQCAKMLLKKEVKLNMAGPFNWTALEHASFRGFTEICNLIKDSFHPEVEDADSDSSSTTSPNTMLSPKSMALEKKSCKIHRSYGHPFLKEHSVVQIIVGTVDKKDKSDPVVFFDSNAFDLALQMQISINEQVEFVALPIQDKHTIDPLSFTCLNPADQRVEFKIFSDKCIGVGALFLSSLFINKHVIYNAPRMTTQIPLFKNDRAVGLITVQVVVINPFIHPSIHDFQNSYWKELKVRIIGHRGNGADKARKGLHVAENTILSFVTAANLGAEYIEFDVQVTKDLVPVIYHDFIVKETGVKIPINGLTKAEFQTLISNEEGYASDDEYSQSLKSKSFEVMEKVKGRKATRTPKEKHKAFLNTVIKTPFGTLEDAFKMVPSHVGFNIEVKYPNHDEVMEEGIFCTDLNSFIDSVLTCVYEHCKTRPVIFSSFHPEVCTMLNMKQPHFPIFFLTDSGFTNFQDIRLNSLQAAVRFAKTLGLMGIVTFNEPLIISPKLIKEVKSTGLLLFSYGKKNNDLVYSKLQTKHGIDAVIVDSVCAVRKGLSFQ
eukprot:NODE_76_length_23837_cov_1.242396.p2 type:complete len:806 gc:universal NODE_76_length_23837_cov_1.242396:16268-13851(-)